MKATNDADSLLTTGATSLVRAELLRLKGGEFQVCSSTALLI